MSGICNFKFKVKFIALSYDYDKKVFCENGFVKIYYAEDFNELKKVFTDFINGDSRFINVRFNTENKELNLTKCYADEKSIEHELINGLDYDLVQINDKVFFVLTSNGNLHWWDRLDSEGSSKGFTLFDYCDTNENVEYIATVRLVINKEDKNYD